MEVLQKGFADRYKEIALCRLGGGRYTVTARLRDGDAFVTFGLSSSLEGALQGLGIRLVDQSRGAQ